MSMHLSAYLLMKTTLFTPEGTPLCVFSLGSHPARKTLLLLFFRGLNRIQESLTWANREHTWNPSPVFGLQTCVLSPNYFLVWSMAVMKLASLGLWELKTDIPSQFRIWGRHVGSWKLAMAGVFTPRKEANATHKGCFFPKTQELNFRNISLPFCSIVFTWDQMKTVECPCYSVALSFFFF